jgi:cytoskeleton protein RodZ
VNKPVKLPEIRKEAFTKARESLGLSTKDVSGMSCFSVRQIEQIESGEISSFYGLQNKITAAKRVAELLKLKPEDAFDFSGIAIPTKATEVEEDLQDTKTPVAAKKENKVSPEKEAAPMMAKVSESKLQTIAANKSSQSTTDYRVPSKASANPKKKIFLLAAIGAAVIFSVLNLRPLFFPEPVKEEVVIIQEVTPEPPPAPEPAADTKPVAAPVVESAPAAVAAAVSTECPAADASPLNYKPDAPKKAGDMVYLQSKTSQTVCVVDATGKTQNKTLEPGVGASVYGKPPFKVLTGGLNQVDLYYQGAKVRLGNTGSKTINLEPAEIIQPAAPLNSSDSQLR